MYYTSTFLIAVRSFIKKKKQFYLLQVIASNFIIQSGRESVYLRDQE